MATRRKAAKMCNVMELKSRGTIAVVVGLCLLSGCSGSIPESASIARADRLTLYEGLPHPVEETISYNAERKRKPIFELHGSSFYRAALELKAGDEQKLKALLASSKTFEPFSGEKKCGGFHPDYAVEWSVGKTTYSCLICLGCGEAKIYGLGADSYYDIQPDAHKHLKEILQPYRVNRPPHEPLSAAGPSPSNVEPESQPGWRLVQRGSSTG
jgi:hypothetical protein